MLQFDSVTLAVHHNQEDLKKSVELNETLKCDLTATKDELWQTNAETTHAIEASECVILTQGKRLDELSGLNSDLHE